MIRIICSLFVCLSLFAYVSGYFVTRFATGGKIALLGLLVTVTVAAVFFVYRLLEKVRKSHRYAQLARSFLAVSAEVDEVFILDEESHLVFSKSGLSTPDIFSFSQLINEHLEDHDSALETCEQALSQGLYFEDIFRMRQENSWEDDRYVRIRILPLFTSSLSAPSYRALLLSDVTLFQKKEWKNHPTSDALLEQYLDTAPFGLVYIDAQGTILGSNAVFRRWISERRSVLGVPFLTFLMPPLSLQDVISAHRGINVSLISGKNLFLYTAKMNEACFGLTLIPIVTSLPLPSRLLNQLPIPSLTVDSKGLVQKMNTMLRNLLTKQREDLLVAGRPVEEKLDETSKKKWENALKMGSAARHMLELHFENSDLSVLGSLKKLENDEVLVQLMDTSEQKKLEQQFAQAQKTQAVGQLAGGIAHDFNNLLTAIIGFCDLLLQRIMPNDPSFVDIMHIKQNANRAANLVRQLLAFSRRQSLQPRRINVAETMSDLSALLRRLIGSQIEFHLHQNRNLWPVKADVGQFEQVIINLVVNARDAMESGGILTLETTNYTNKVAKNLGNDIMLPGDYVLISIKDSGCGIAPDLIKSIFEPFFSTKPKGQGTGLGLATVYGIVKQTGGVIDVESQVGVGSTFKVYLPRCRDTEEVVVPEKKRVQDVTGTETILLVEDEDAVRIFASRALRDKGYRVLEAANGKAALHLIHEGARPNILITDVSMPEMDGPSLSSEIQKILPEIPTIFMSGYAEETFRKNLSENQKLHFLLKPFTLRDLATKVREILE